MKALRIGRAGVICALVLLLAALPRRVSAQSGQLKGKVVDAQNKPVADAKITMLATETESQDGDEDRLQGRVAADRPAARQLHRHGRKGRHERRSFDVRVASTRRK